MNATSIPAAISSDMQRAVRLEYWTLLWIASIGVVMGLAMGSSQAMKSAWVEDVLSLVPAVVFLVAVRFERRAVDEKFPYGYNRVNSLSFLIAAVSLMLVGAYLLFNAISGLIRQEHPTIGSTTLLGHDIWMGWIMIAALIYSVIPPLILGHKKLPLARRLQDKVLHTDAQMQKADWMTGLAGIVGVLGVGFGYWWADAVAAGFISFEILRDGLKNLRIATAELIDGVPRALDENGFAPDALTIQNNILARYPDATVRMRESGRFIHARIDGVGFVDPHLVAEFAPSQRPWRLASISYSHGAGSEINPGSNGNEADGISADGS